MIELPGHTVGSIGLLYKEENDVLGLGMPMQSTKTIRISPNPCGLRWASGRALCEDGEIFLHWSADDDTHTLDMMLYLPEGWCAQYEFPYELRGWTVLINGKKYMPVE